MGGTVHSTTVDFETYDPNDTSSPPMSAVSNVRDERYGNMNRQQRRAQMARERRAARRG